MAADEDLEPHRGAEDAGAPPESPSAPRPDDAPPAEFATAEEAAPVETTRPIDDDLTAAVREAQAGPYVPGGRFEPPRSIAMLVFVLVLLVGMGAYGLVWTRNLAAQNERIRLRTLEERDAKHAEQQRFVRAHGYLPAGREAKPLEADERAELEALREAYGTTKPAATQAAPPVAPPGPPDAEGIPSPALQQPAGGGE